LDFIDVLLLSPIHQSGGTGGDHPQYVFQSDKATIWNGNWFPVFKIVAIIQADDTLRTSL
jgi:hypothetical protein